MLSDPNFGIVRHSVALSTLHSFTRTPLTLPYHFLPFDTMSVFVHKRRAHKRQDPSIPPQLSGIITQGTATVTGASIATGLVIDTSASGGGTLSSTLPAWTVGPATESAATGSATAKASSDSSTISMGTVLGACLGSFLGVSIVLITAVYLYKRSGKKARERKRPFVPLGGGGGRRPNTSERRRSQAGAMRWKQTTDDKEDVWEGKNPPRLAAMASTEKLHPFPGLANVPIPPKPAALPRPTETRSYDSGIAQSSETKSPQISPASSPREKVGRSGRPVSTDGDVVDADNSFLAMRDARASGAISPQLVTAMTPTAVSGDDHRWHSAAVEHFGSVETIKNPFADQDDEASPFGLSTGAPLIRKPSNPFDDPQLQSHPYGAGDTLSATPTTFSTAYKGLLAALDGTLNPADAQLLGVRPQHDSFVSSRASSYTNMDEEDVTNAFPVPPTTIETSGVTPGRSS